MTLARHRQPVRPPRPTEREVYRFRLQKLERRARVYRRALRRAAESMGRVAEAFRRLGREITEAVRMLHVKQEASDG